MKSWSEEINTQIDKSLEGINDKDFRFFRVAEFKRNISRTDTFSNTCATCKKQQQNIKEIVGSIDIAINNPGKNRREYDKLISRIAKHMQKEHGFYSPYYFTYYYSFFGLIVGSVVGFLLMQINPEYKLELFFAGIALGLLPTYVLGYLKDKNIRSQKKLM